MTPTQARTFHAVAAAGSFTAAAKALHVSQPTVTTQIKDLEQYYDVELFFRRARGVTVTPTGHELLEIVRRIDAGQKEAVEFLGAVKGLQTGHLRVGAYAASDVMTIVAAFSRKYPGPNITVTFANSYILQEQLLDHQLDVGILSQREPMGKFYSLPFRMHTHQVVIFHPHHVWRQQQSITVGELCEEIIIIREPSSEANRATEHILSQASTTPDKIIQVGSREGVMSAVAQGLGVSTIFDEGIVPAEAVTKRPIEDAEVSTSISVACLEERKDSRIIAAFLTVAEQCLANRSA